nr:MAG: polyprotein [Iflaviridae sp.]
MESNETPPINNNGERRLKSIDKAMKYFGKMMTPTMAFLQNRYDINILFTNEHVLTVSENDKMNHAIIREFKSIAADFLNTLVSCGIRVTVNGPLCYSLAPMYYVSSLNPLSILKTVVIAPSETERRLWLTVLHAIRLHRELTYQPIQHEMDTREGPATQQMEDQLISDEVSHKNENTEITKEVDDSTNAHIDDDVDLQMIATTENFAALNELTTRNIRLVFEEPLQFSTTNTANQDIFVLDIPNGLYRFLDTTIATALRNFTLIKTDVVLTFKVNANQAQCGRYIVGHYPCWDQVPAPQDSVYRMLQRDHAIIDISKSNDVVYTLRYENLRPLLPIQTDELGDITGGSFARLFLKCLSPMRIADTGNSVCPLQVIARFENPMLTGMRFPLPVDVVNRARARADIKHEALAPVASTPAKATVISAVKNVNSALGSIPVFGSIWKWLGSALGNTAVAITKVVAKDQTFIDNFENNLKYVGMINKDRPVDISHPSPLMPQPVHSYSYGRGAYASKKLRIEPQSTTPHVPGHDTIQSTQSVLDLARIPGLWTTFTVSTSNVQGDTLIELPAIPYDPRYRTQLPVLGTQNALYSIVELPPVTYFSGMYQYYAGSITYEFIPIKTPSHNFSIQVSFVPFNGDPGVTTEEQLQSCTWKIIDFRTSTEGTFDVPWLSTSVMRQWPTPVAGILGSNNALISQGNTIRAGSVTMKDPGKVVVKLVNQLNPTPIVSPEIEILVMMRAHENLRYMSPCQTRFPPSKTQNLSWVTRDYTQSNATTRSPLIGAVLVRPSFEMGEVQQGDEMTLPDDKLRQAFGPQIQTMEKHDNILDISRRFMYHTTLTGTRYMGNTVGSVIGNVPYIATMPITVYSLNTYAGGPNDAFNQALATQAIPPTNTRELFAMCFRWGRGGQNFVLHALNDFPIEVTYIPPIDFPYHISGGLEDVLSLKSSVLFNGINLYPTYVMPTATGYPNEVIEPRVNPILTIENPMMNINNYMDLQAPLWTFDDDFPDMDDYPQQDLISLTNGQLLIRQLTNINTNNPVIASNSANAFRVRVQSALADDFMFYHFMGVPPTLLTPLNNWTMTHTHNRMVTRVLSRDEIENQLLAAGIESNPGPVLSSFFAACNSGVRSLTDKVAIIKDIKEFVQTSTSVSNSFGELKEKGFSMLEEFKLIIAAYVDGIDICAVTSLALALTAAMEKGASRYVVCSAVLQLLTVIGIFHTKVLSFAVDGLMSVFGKADNKPAHEMDFESNNAVAGIIASMFCESVNAFSTLSEKPALNFNYVKKTVASIFKNFNFSRTGSMCLFFTRMCYAIKALYTNVRSWILGSAKYDLLANDPTFIQSFMNDYDFFMNELNISQQTYVRKHRDRYWTTVITAYYLNNVLATIKDSKLKNPTLANACKDIIRRANDLKSCMLAPPVRYEPFVLWMYGPPGTGKTTMNEQITVDMAESIGLQTPGEPHYVRNPCDEFWNGYCGQPIVLIDDAGAVDDPQVMGRALLEFQALKSSAKMRLNMAALNDKQTEMTSVLVGVCSNFRNWPTEMTKDSNAFKRRRDCLVKVDFSPEAKAWFVNNNSMQVASKLPDHMRVNNAHLVFAMASDPTKSEATDRPYCSYNEFHKTVISKFKTYHEIEKNRVLDRYKKSIRLAQTAANRVMDEHSLRVALESVMLGSLTDEAQHEAVKRAYLELQQVTPERFKELPKHTQYLLEKIRNHDISFDDSYISPSIAHVSHLATPWFKQNVAPLYFAHSPDMFEFIRSRYMPWKDEERRKFDSAGNVTSACVACQERQSDTRGIAFICARSTLTAQHWICTRCKDNYVQHDADPTSCPTCRTADAFLEVHSAITSWKFFHKVSHVLSTISEQIKSGTRITFDAIQQRASLIIAASYCVFLISIIRMANVEATAEQERNDNMRADIDAFIEYMGVLPEDSYVKSDGNTIFILYNQLYDMSTGKPVPCTPKHEGPGSDTSDKFKSPEHSDDGSDGIETIATSSLASTSEVPTYKMVNGKLVLKGKGKPKKSKTLPIVSPDNTPPPEVYSQCDIVSTASRFCSGLSKQTCVNDHEESELYMKIRSYTSQISCKCQNRSCFKLNADAPHLSLDYENDTWNFVINLRDENNEFKSFAQPLVNCDNDKCMQSVSTRFLLCYYMIQYGKEVPEGSLPLFLEGHYRPAPMVPDPVSWYVWAIDYQTKLVKKLCSVFLCWIQKAYDLMYEKWYWLFSAIVVMFCMWKGYDYYFDETCGIDIQHESPGDSKAQHAKQNRHAATRTYHRGQFQPAHDMNLRMSKKVPPQVDNIAQLILKQRFSISCGPMIAHGFVVKTGFAVFPRHAAYLISDCQKDDVTATMRLTDGTDILLKEIVKDLIVFDGNNAEFIVLRHKRLTGRDIRGHILTPVTDDVTYASAAYAVDIQDGITIPVHVDFVYQLREDLGEVPDKIETHRIVNNKQYTYESYMTDYIKIFGLQGTGKCCSPLIDPSGKVFGLHFAGTNVCDVKVGYSAPIFKEQFVSLDEPVTHDSLATEGLRFYSHYPNPPYHTDKSGIEKSAIHDYAWDSLTVPCIQSHKDPNYSGSSTPLLDGASTIGARTEKPDPIVLSCAASAVADELFRFMPKPTMTTPVSLREAVLAENHCNVEPMRLSTSAGLPLVADMRVHTRKSQYVLVTDQPDGRRKVDLEANFRRVYQSHWKSRMNGVPPREPFWAHLKSERRKPEKAYSFGGTRVFSVAPLELILTSRRVLLPFMDAFHSDPVKLHHAIGISPDSITWTYLLESLRLRGNRVIQLDFSKFSDTLPWDFVYAAFSIIKEYYRRHNILTVDVSYIIDTLCYEITASLVCIGNEVYELVNGVLQGHPLTSIINSIVNLIEQVYVWMLITKLPGSDFFKHCGIVVMGDDVVISLPDFLLPTYNGITIAKAFNNMKIKVTDENKDPNNIKRSQKIEEFSFISRTYQLHPFRECYLAPSEIDAIFDSPLWIRGRDGPHNEKTIENVEQSLMLMYGHGPAMYEMYRALLQHLVPDLSLRSWFDLDYIFFVDTSMFDTMLYNRGLRQITPGKYNLLEAKLGRIGSSPDTYNRPLEAGIGRIAFSHTPDSTANQYHDVDFLNNVRLDTHGTVIGSYKCRCRYKCEEELMKRVAQVEERTKTPKEQFLPFTSQEEGTRILGARIAIAKGGEARGYPSIIAPGVGREEIHAVSF